MKRKGFTLVEMVLILTVVFILATIGAWKVAGLRDEANGVAQDDALAAVLRMQQLADMEGAAGNRHRHAGPHPGAAEQPRGQGALLLSSQPDKPRPKGNLRSRGATVAQPMREVIVAMMNWLARPFPSTNAVVLSIFASVLFLAGVAVAWHPEITELFDVLQAPKL